MLNELKQRLIDAVDDHNHAQQDEAKHIDAFDVINQLRGAGDEEIAKEIDAINKKTDALEE